MKKTPFQRVVSLALSSIQDLPVVFHSCCEEDGSVKVYCLSQTSQVSWKEALQARLSEAGISCTCRTGIDRSWLGKKRSVTVIYPAKATIFATSSSDKDYLLFDKEDRYLEENLAVLNELSRTQKGKRWEVFTFSKVLSASKVELEGKELKLDGKSSVDKSSLLQILYHL